MQNKKISRKALLITGTILAIAIIAIFALTRPAGTPAWAAWVEDGATVSDAITLIHGGDTVKFRHGNKTYNISSTEMVYWEKHGRELDSNDYPTHWDFTMTLPANGSTFQDICFEREPDPACKNNPGLMVYNEQMCYHVSESNIEMTEHETEIIDENDEITGTPSFGGVDFSDIDPMP